MTAGELFVCLVVGLALPLAILDAARVILDGEMPVQVGGLQLERRLVPWILAVVAGPALMFDRVAEGWRDATYSRADLLSGVVITVGWALIYGYVVLRGVQALQF